MLILWQNFVFWDKSAGQAELNAVFFALATPIIIGIVLRFLRIPTEDLITSEDSPLPCHWGFVHDFVHGVEKAGEPMRC